MSQEREKMERHKIEELDDDIIGAAVDTTLRSVFSKDYTTDSFDKDAELEKLNKDLDYTKGFLKIVESKLSNKK